MKFATAVKVLDRVDLMVSSNMALCKQSSGTRLTAEPHPKIGPSFISLTLEDRTCAKSLATKAVKVASVTWSVRVSEKRPSSMTLALLKAKASVPQLENSLTVLRWSPQEYWDLSSLLLFWCNCSEKATSLVLSDLALTSILVKLHKSLGTSKSIILERTTWNTHRALTRVKLVQGYGANLMNLRHQKSMVHISIVDSSMKNYHQLDLSLVGWTWNLNSASVKWAFNINDPLKGNPHLGIWRHQSQ